MKASKLDTTSPLQPTKAIHGFLDGRLSFRDLFRIVREHCRRAVAVQAAVHAHLACAMAKLHFEHFAHHARVGRIKAANVGRLRRVARSPTFLNSCICCNELMSKKVPATVPSR